MQKGKQTTKTNEVVENRDKTVIKASKKYHTKEITDEESRSNGDKTVKKGKEFTVRRGREDTGTIRGKLHTGKGLQ